jgi:hypothetical protein
MPRRKLERARSGNWRSRRRVRALVLAMVVAALTTILAAGTASADMWPHSPDTSAVISAHA